MFTTPLGTGVSLGVQGGYPHRLDTILELEQVRATFPFLQKIVDGSDATNSPLGLAAIVSDKWAQVQVAGPGTSVNADDVQAILQSFLADRQGQGVAVQEHNMTVYIEESNGDRLILSPDGSGLKSVGQGIATVQTEYAKGGKMLATSSIQGDDDGNTLITRRGAGFKINYALNSAGQMSGTNGKSFDATNQLQSQWTQEWNPDGFTSLKVYNSANTHLSTTRRQLFDDLEGQSVLDEVTNHQTGEVSLLAYGTDGTVKQTGLVTAVPGWNSLTEEVKQQRLQDDLFAGSSSFLNALRAKDKVGMLLSGGKMGLDYARYSGANTTSLDGFLGNVSATVGVLGALQGLRSRDTRTQLGSASNLLHSANFIAGRLGATASGDPAHADFMTVVKSLRAGGQNIGGSRKVCSRYLLNSCSRPFYLGKRPISYRGSSQRATGKAVWRIAA